MTLQPQPNKEKLQQAIDSLLDRMITDGYDTEDYPKMMEQLTKLYKLKEQDAPRRVSPDTWILVGGNLIGIVLILTYERLNIVTSKAIAFVLKPRI